TYLKAMTEFYVGSNAVLKYFETHNRKTWNYEHFLNELREIIIDSPPEDWSGLDGTWYNRYIYYAKDNDNERRQMKPFFQDIILEREKRNAAKNYVIEGVKVLNEARFSSSDIVISTTNKWHSQIEKVNNEPPRSPEHQIYQPEQNQRRAEKKVSDHELASNLSDDYNKDYTDPYPLTEKHRQMIEQTFNGMKKDRMWRLSTGKYVEEELFELGKKLRFEHAVHSFILDVDDEIIRQHFNEAELDEIDCAPGPQVYELSEEIAGFLNKFADKTSLAEIRKFIKEMMFDDKYDHEKDHDKDYIIYALYSFVREIQSGSLKDANIEAWFNCHVWNVIFDKAFGDINAISIVRGECTSLASASRKNGARKVGKSWVNENGSKFLKEAGLKLPKTLKDKLVKLMEKAGWDEESRAKIQTVGIIHAGLMIMTVFLDNPKGYICRVQRGELMEVPDNAENFPYILTILASVLNIKAVIQEIIKTVRAKKQTVESYKMAGFRKRPLDKNEDRVYPCLSTPKKAKMCAEAYTEK
ncbi:2405_t:CDS:10, partial [Acaulospora morrowiae]